MTEWNRDISWRQGYFLDKTTIIEQNLVLPDFADSTLVIIASHDCDLAQPPDTEPVFEVVIGHFIDNLDGSCTNTKNPRKLHLSIESPGGQKYAELITIDRAYLPKALLPDIKYDEELHLSTTDLTIFRRWLSIRYNRSAFPDQFDRRLKNNEIDKKIARALRKHGEFITAIFFDVDEGIEVNRVDSNDTYLLDISILYSTEIDPEAAAVAAEEAKEAIVETFKKKLFNNTTKNWVEIELRYCDVFSDEAFSYRQSVTYKQWRLEHISFSVEPPHEVIKQQ